MTTDVEQLADDYRQQRDALALFDVNCWLGRPFEPTFTAVDSLESLKKMLTRYGIRRAVLSHTMCVRYDAEAGNRALMEMLGHDESLVGAATLVPEMARSGAWDSVLRSLIAGRIRMVRLFPRSHNFLLDDEYLGGMLQTLQDLRLPVVFWHTEAAWPEIAEVCSHYRELTVIVEGTGRKLFYDNRVYRALLERFPNLYLETHNLTNYLGLDDLVRCFGSRRFLFGSYFPHEDPNSAAMLLTHGELAAADRENIAHRNLENLIAEVRQPSPTEQVVQSGVAVVEHGEPTEGCDSGGSLRSTPATQAVSSCQLVSTRTAGMIVDVHCHLGRSPQFRFADASVGTMLRVMDRLGIDRAVCCHLAFLHGEPDLGLRESVQAYRESEGRLLLYAVFDPNQSGSMDFVHECLEREGFVGVKIHPSFHGCYADDDRYEPVWRVAAQRRIPILAHSWDVSEQNPAQKYSFPSRFERFVTNYPDVTLILGHAGGRYGGHVAAADLASRYPHVFLDLAGDCYTLGLVEYLVEHAGPDKILFGSDLTWIDPRTQLGMILDANISVEDKKQILGLNAARILGLEIESLTTES